MHRPIAPAQLFDRPDIGENKSMLGTNSRTLAVNRLRTGHYYLADGQVLLANNFQKLGSSERVYVHVFRNLRHVTAVGGLVEDDVDIAQGVGHGRPIAHIALQKLDLIGNPGRLAATMRLWFEIVEHADLPSVGHEQVGDVRTDEAGPARDESAFSFLCHTPRRVALRPLQGNRLEGRALSRPTIMGRHGRHPLSLDWPDSMAAFSLDNLSKKALRVWRCPFSRVYAQNFLT